MVVCKYYQRGNCRYGQYCQFEHINNFGNRRTDGTKSLAQQVAEEIHFAERGGQWLLSCFGPLKEKPCIPGMEDLSPEEVRWEMYQAKENGMVEQAKMQFQKLCQDMKTKRDALKNPTGEMVLMLEKFEAGGQGNGFNSGSATNGKSTFTFATPQLGFPTSTASSNVFGNKFGGQNNVFNSTFSSPGNMSVFARPSGPGFNGKSTFVNNTPFTNSSTGNPIFGSMKTGTSSVFGETPSNVQPYSSVSQQNNSVFGTTTTQPNFGQPSVFGAATQATNVFAKPQVSQSIFGGSSTLFSASPAQNSTSLFGGGKSPTANPFGGVSATTLQTTNSIFGSTTTVETSNMNASTIFGPPKNTVAFGGTPVFGTAPNFGNNPTGTVFGGQPTFGNTSLSNSNVFRGSNTAVPSFASINPNPAGGFHNATAVTAPTVFSATTDSASSYRQNTNATPFASTISNPFVTSSSQFITAGTPSITPFATTTFAPESSFSAQNNAPFGTNNGTNRDNINFGNQNASPFATTSTTVTSTVSNPFAPRTQQTSFPFGQTCSTTSATTVPNDPFAKTPFGSNAMVIIDDSVYSLEDQLTDDEKSMYLAEKFVLGKIPLKPPSKSIS